jgi:NAD(P)-dependent dehydrogenase (short-subunit alcohol dehydrogenase family)
MADLSGRVAVVTEADGGLGRGIAEGLAEAGATVYLTGRAEDAERAESGDLAAAGRAVETFGGKAFAVPLTAACDRALTALFERIRAEQGRLDLLVNHAGNEARELPAAHPFWEQSPSLWDAAGVPELRSRYAAAVLAARAMVEQGSGLIVNVAAPEDGRPLGVAAGMELAALERMGRDMSRDLAPHGVTVLTLIPAPLGEAVSAAGRAGDAQTVPGAAAPRFTGRCVAALAMDPDILEKTGGVYQVTGLQPEYRFTDPNRA